MNKITLALSLLAAGSSSMMASTGYAFLDALASQTRTNVFDNQYISPYSGATGTSTTESQDTPVQLFCEDFADHVNWGTSWAATFTNVTAASGTNSRYGATNNNTTYPAGVGLYEEIAWLFTQEVAPNQTIGNVDEIQEAVWIMTGAAGTTPTGLGHANTVAWITAAQTYYLSDSTHTPDAYEVADYSRWTVVTDTASIGHPTGSGNQEFLAYTPAGGIPGTGFGKVPEPASFVLFGSGLLAVGLIGRRKLAKQ